MLTILSTQLWAERASQSDKAGYAPDLDPVALGKMSAYNHAYNLVRKLTQEVADCGNC